MIKNLYKNHGQILRKSEMAHPVKPPQTGDIGYIDADIQFMYRFNGIVWQSFNSEDSRETIRYLLLEDGSLVDT